MNPFNNPKRKIWDANRYAKPSDVVENLRCCLLNVTREIWEDCQH